MQPARRLCRAGGRPSFTLLSSAVCGRLFVVCISGSKRLETPLERKLPSKCGNCKLTEHSNAQIIVLAEISESGKLRTGSRTHSGHCTRDSPRVQAARRHGGARGLCVPAGWGRLTPTRPSWKRMRSNDVPTWLLGTLLLMPTWRTKTCRRRVSALAAHHLSGLWVERHPWSKGGSDRRAHRSATLHARSLAWPPSAPIQNTRVLPATRTPRTPLFGPQRFCTR